METTVVLVMNAVSPLPHSCKEHALRAGIAAVGHSHQKTLALCMALLPSTEFKSPESKKPGGWLFPELQLQRETFK